MVQMKLGATKVDIHANVAAWRTAAGPPVRLLLLDPPPECSPEVLLKELEEFAAETICVLMIRTPDVALARLARRHGFRGVMPKTTEVPVMVAALHLLLAGGEYFPCFDIDIDNLPPPPAHVASAKAPLSRRQAEILAELEAGSTNKEIARKLGISIATVKMHVRALLNLVGARNRTEAVMRFRRTGP
jgi:DNA-binding NarL/FixJ family response regulator